MQELPMQNKLPNNKSTTFKNNTVLVTGAGGTIGSELVLRMEAKTIIAVDISEYAIYKLQRQIKDKNIHCIVGDVSDSKIIDLIFKKYSIDYIFNAAAYKHVDTLEDENNTYSVVKNNIMSVINLCEHTKNVKGVIHISSDKAVNPINNMGFTKLWCERIIQHYARNSITEFKIVRFGNIYNSAGSFIETLQWQIETKQPITITDTRMKRYFMTVQDAVSLILKIANLEHSNTTYILEMGEEISIMDLIPRDYPTELIGIRPGEKLREELIYDYEQIEDTDAPMIKRVAWHPVDMAANINNVLQELNEKTICLTKLSEIITTTTIL
jgi:FlaA1/EpsC-like NDP-sugar epimerase